MKLLRFSKKAIAKNISFLNILLFAAVIILLNYIVLPLSHIRISYTLPVGEKERIIKDAIPQTAHMPSLEDYAIIVNENLFHPQRSIPPEKKVDLPPPPMPEFVLYGTIISDDFSFAYLEDLKAPRTTPGRGKRQTAIRQGDSISGFILKEIQSDKIVMLRGEEKIIVTMLDRSRPKERRASATSSSPKQTQAASVSTSKESKAQQPSEPKKIEPKSRKKIDQDTIDFFQSRTKQ